MEKEHIASGKERKSHHGDNLVLARKWKKMTQSDVADKVGLHQTEISTLEKQEIIDEVLLERIAKAMEIPVSFFTDFDMGEQIKTYINNSTNTQDNNFAENSHDTVNQNISDQYNYYTGEDMSEVSDKILKIQKELLEDKHALDKENALLKQELEFLKNKK